MPRYRVGYDGTRVGDKGVDAAQVQAYIDDLNHQIEEKSTEMKRLMY